MEKAHGQTEKREYYQTDEIKWLEQRKNWKGPKSIGMARKTITRWDGTQSVEHRYFISSLQKDIALFSIAVRSEPEHRSQVLYQYFENGRDSEGLALHEKETVCAVSEA